MHVEGAGLTPGRNKHHHCLLGGSWLVISGVISPLTWVISLVTLLITPRITTHELPSRMSPVASQAPVCQTTHACSASAAQRFDFD